MSNVTQFFTTSGGTRDKKNRRFFIGPGSFTWTAPSTTTEVEVHCWGGGGNNGGGGGGYVTHTYPISSSDTLSITVGAPGGTSSVTIPTQTPTSPISATGGVTWAPGMTTSAGGTGQYSIAPGISISKTFAAAGGTGGFSAGGGAGFIYGPGGSGAYSNGGGGGIKGDGAGAPSGSGNGGGFQPGASGGSGIDGSRMGYTIAAVQAPPGPTGVPGPVGSTNYNNFDGGGWFYLDEIRGVGGPSYFGPAGSGPSDTRTGGAGGGGGQGSGPSGTAGGSGGIFGGGGSGTSIGGDGGLAGGGGGPTGGVGGAGVVIIYW